MYTANQFVEVLNGCDKRLKVEEVQCPEIKDDFVVRIKELPASLVDFWSRCFEEIIEDTSKQLKYGSPSQLVVALSVVDQAGDRVFKPYDFKSHEVIGKMPSVVKDRIAEAAYALNKMRKSDREAVGKNSQPTLDGDS